MRDDLEYNSLTQCQSVIYMVSNKSPLALLKDTVKSRIMDLTRINSMATVTFVEKYLNDGSF